MRAFRSSDRPAERCRLAGLARPISQASACGLLFVAALATASPAEACTEVSSGSYECTGDSYADPLQITVGDGKSLTFSLFDLTTAGITVPANGGPALFARSDGREGGDGSNDAGAGGTVTITFAPGTPDLFEVEVSDSFGFRGRSAGGDGRVFSADDPVELGGTGSAGGAGGDGGAVSITVSDTRFEVVTLPSIYAESLAGAGGHGEKKTNTSLTGSTPNGGRGGTGGSGGTVSLVISDTAVGGFAQISLPPIGAISKGGAGGDGGEGHQKGNTNRGQGGAGGDGGSGGDVTLVFEDGVTLAPDSQSAAVLAQSEAGDGGIGGQGNSSFTGAPSYGGSGGEGGQGGSVAVISLGSLEIATTDSIGIRAESLGGAGGNGGRGRSCGTCGTAHGGDAGEGGDGGQVEIGLSSSLSLHTEGAAAHGIMARSYGGDGGNGGAADGGSSGKGGAAKGPGPGGGVTVTGGGLVETEGEGADGILAQSIGGFAGDAGSASGFVVTYAGNTESAGDGGTVSLSWSQSPGGDSRIATGGDFADAIFAQSIGGGGGKGASGSSIVALGSSGSAGGAGGLVEVLLGTVEIETSGEGSRGLAAASVGNGGGDGGGAKGLVGIGGSGSGGGKGGIVKVTSSAAIATAGDSGVGLFAQSLGGGGGNGRSTSGLVSIGGDGGTAAKGDSVTVTNDGDVSTEGDHADAIYVESAGGGGGRGATTTAIGVGFAYAVGGSGDGGGDGGTVTYGYDDTSFEEGVSIATQGEASRGLVVQSIGGGGGTGGNSFSGAAGLIAQGSIAVGGQAGGGGSGSSVVTDFAGAIVTSGDSATGVLAQSVGGGGGRGGNAISVAGGITGLGFSLGLGGDGGGGGAGGAVTLTYDGALHTQGDNAEGVLAQSLGGGGGSSGTTVSATGAIGGAAISIGVGGDAGGGGKGSKVELTYAGSVVTEGDNATALTALSEGGGGGSSGTTVTTANTVGGTLDVGVGGTGGSGGNGGAVILTKTTSERGAGESIETSGDNSGGLLASSVGGGGGNSGATITGSAISMQSVNIGVGGSSGGGGSGGEVTVISSGSIATLGDNAAAIAASSLGKGGGTSGLSVTASGATSLGSVAIGIGGAGGSGGGASDVTVVSSDSITTAGFNSGGINAQSLAGSGGSGGINAAGSLITVASLSITAGGSGGSGGTSGNVEVDFTGSIETAEAYSPGINAESRGGAGGVGAVQVVGNLLVPGPIDINVGSSGGSGGTAGDVLLANSGAVGTDGHFSPGLVATSAGGDGGSGGLSVSLNAVSADSLSVTLGGDGGGAGSAGSATVANEGDLTTGSVYSPGILANSIGGSGGSGGFAFEGGVQVGTPFEGVPTVSLSYTMGGEGGGGATGGAVSVTNLGGILTQDYASPGISAASRGGNGGDGGNVYTGLIQAESKEGTYNITVDVGGAGGGGGTGKAVTVDNHGAITTESFVSDGIFASSLGGNGGSGGSNYNVQIAADVSGSKGNLVTEVGGKGGDGAVGGAVTVTNRGAIATREGESRGIYAQSIGGNGGRGGNSANLLLNLDAKVIKADAPAAASAPATSAAAAGPQAGIQVGEVLDDETTQHKLSATVTVGGAGGKGAHAGKVKITNIAPITTEGLSSEGLFAQSVGGGGGDGGSAGSKSYSWAGVCGINVVQYKYYCKNDAAESDSKAQTVSFSTAFSLGGSGGAAGNGNTVTIDNRDDITTSGVASAAIFAQSVGGGGGTGGNGQAGALGLWTSNETASTLNDIYYLLNRKPIQDLKSASVSIAVGGSGGAAGDGDHVTVTNSGTLTTEGEESYAIHAQSIGGGGGDGGKAAQAWTYSIIVGGTGSGGGDGGTVDVTSNGAIVTSGKGGLGIFAQSVGDGGGNGGNFSGGLSYGFFTVPVGINLAGGGFPGAGGDGGLVRVRTTAPIATSGENAHGIFAQSVGGSGGAAGVGDTLTSQAPQEEGYYIGNVGGKGDGGTVQVTVESPITVTGEGAHGVFAQSVGGPDSSSEGGSVQVAANADIVSTGSGGRAIFAQSLGGGGNGDITLFVTPGVEVSAAEDGFEAILVSGGDANSALFNNGGTISRPEGTTPEGGTGYVIAVVEQEGFSIFNSGTISGTLYFDPDSSSGGLFNRASGLLELSGESWLPATFSTDGTLTAGAGDAIASAEFTGPTSASSRIAAHLGGTIKVDYQFGDGNEEKAQSDLFIVDPSAIDASVVGLIDPQATGVNLVQKGTTGEFLLFTDVNAAAFAATIEDDAIVNWGLETLDSTDGVTSVVLTYELNSNPWLGFASGGYDQALSTEEEERVNDNLIEVGNYLDRLVSARISDRESGSDQLAFVDGMTDYLLGIQQISTLVEVYESWSPQIATAPLNTALFSALRFNDSLQGCPRYDEAGLVSLSQEGNCVWARAQGGSLQRQASDSVAAYTENSYGFEGGFQMEVAPELFAGFAFLFEDATLKSGEVASGSGQRYQGGLVVRKDLPDGLILSGAVTGGVSDYDLSRPVITPSGTRTASSSPTTAFVTGHLRAAKFFVFEGSSLVRAPYLKPTGDLGLIHQWQGSYSESGAGDYGATIEDVSQTFVTLNPFLEAGAGFDLFGLQARGYGRAGILSVLGGDHELEGAFNGVPAGGPTFSISEEIPTVSGDLALGIEVAARSNLSFRVEGSTLVAGKQQSYFGTGRVTLHF